MFPLLRLPILVIIEVLKEIGIMDLIQLSRTSTKMSQLVERNRKNDNDISINIIAHPNRRWFELRSENETVQIRMNRACDYPQYVKKTYWKFENQSNLVEFLNAEEIILNFDNPALGLIPTGQYLIKLFKCSFDKVELHELPEQTLEAIVNLLEEHEVCRLEIFAKKSDNIQLVLDKIRIGEELVLVKEYNPQLPRPVLRNVPKEVRIHDASWMDFSHLQEMNFQKLLIGKSSLTNWELDQLVTKWKRGEFPNLKHIHLNSNAINEQETIGGMVPPIFVPDRNRIEASIAGVSVLINGGVEIQRNDGVKGRICLKTGFLSKPFFLFVCD